MTNDDRALILTDVRTALATRGPSRPPTDIAASAAQLLADPERLRPTLPHADVIESFIGRIIGPKVGATADRIDTIDALPAAISSYLAGRNIAPTLSCLPQPVLHALDWTGARLTTDPELPDDGGTLVALARWGIAETGSVVLHSSAETAILPNFLALTQIFAVRADAIVPYLEDYATAARAATDPAPRNACLITGASGTSDIEGAFVRGAHGPRHVHIVVIG